MSVGLNLISCFSCSKCLVLPRGSCLWRRGLLWAMVWGWLVVCRVPVGGEEVAGSPAGGCRSWGHNHNLGAASLGLALCPEPGGFRSQMSQQPWREGGKGTQEGRCLAPLSPKPQWPVRLKAPEPGLCIRPSRGLAGGLSPPSRAQPPTVGMDPLAPCSPHKRLRLRFASSLGVGLTSKNEFEENRRRSRHATAPSAHWPPVETLVFGVMFPEGLPSLLPLPTHLTRCWPITPAGIKWLPARRAPSREVSPPAGTGRSSVTQHAGTVYSEDTAQ